MKCNPLHTALLLGTTTFAFADPGLGQWAANVNPLLSQGAYLMHILMSFLSMVFTVYAYTLWRHHRRNPAFTPISNVITAVLVAVSCAFFAISTFYAEDFSKTPAKSPIRTSVTQPKKSTNLHKIK